MKNILLCLFCVSVLASCTISSKTPEVTSSWTPVNAQYKADLDTASNKIKDTQDFADCMAPSVNMCINSVGMQLAQKAKSTEFCKELSSPEQQEGCRFTVIMSLASENNDPTACNSLSWTYIIQCTEAIYRSQAFVAKDIRLCEKLEVRTDKDINPGDITMLDGTHSKKDDCIFNILISDQNSTIKDCEKIQEQSSRDMCISQIKNREMMNSQQ